MKLLIISGSMGAGKTTVLAEASDILSMRAIPHATIDLDALAVAHLVSPQDDGSLMHRNLASVWANCAEAGLTALLVARALEDRTELERIRGAVASVEASGAETVVCRLTARIKTMRERVRGRETGMHQRKFVERVAELDRALDRARIENFTVENDGGSVTDVALEVLMRAGWI